MHRKYSILPPLKATGRYSFLDGRVKHAPGSIGLMKDEIRRDTQGYGSVRPILGHVYWTAANPVEVDVTIDIFVSCHAPLSQCPPFSWGVHRLILHFCLYIYFPSLLGNPSSSQASYYPLSTDTVIDRATVTPQYLSQWTVTTNLMDECFPISSCVYCSFNGEATMPYHPMSNIHEKLSIREVPFKGAYRLAI